MQSLLRPGSTSLLAGKASNRHLTQNNVSIPLIPHSCFIVSAQPMEFNCRCLYVPFQPTLNHSRERNRLHRWEEDYVFFLPIYCKWKVQENVSSYQSHKRQKPLKRGRSKERNGSQERRGEGLTGNSSGGDRQVFEVFLDTFYFRSCLSKNIQDENWVREKKKEAEVNKYKQNSGTVYIIYAGSLQKKDKNKE